MYKFVGEDNRQRLVTEDVIALVLTGTREIVSSRRAVSNVSTMKIKNRYVRILNSMRYLHVYIDIVSFQNPYNGLHQKEY